VAPGTAPDRCITLTRVIKPARRVVTVLTSFTIAAVIVTWAFADAAGASTTSYEAAQPLGTASALLLFVGGPIGLFLLIWLLVVARQLSRRPKREDDLAWFREITAADEVESPS
jgi:hypothetical protein